nr:MAG TPA: hypothetical protein [Caudoviricetes sp.]
MKKLSLYSFFTARRLCLLIAETICCKRRKADYIVLFL